MDNDAKHVFHQYVLKVDPYCVGRDKVADHLAKNGVGTAVHYPFPIYWQPLYQEIGYEGTVCPNTEEACRRVLSLPVHPLVDKKDIEYMLVILKEIS